MKPLAAILRVFGFAMMILGVALYVIIQAAGPSGGGEGNPKGFIAVRDMLIAAAIGLVAIGFSKYLADRSNKSERQPAGADASIQQAISDDRNIKSQIAARRYLTVMCIAFAVSVATMMAGEFLADRGKALGRLFTLAGWVSLLIAGVAMVATLSRWFARRP